MWPIIQESWKRKNEHVKFCGYSLDCQKYGKTFKTQQSLTGHKKAKHTEKYQCKVCQKYFESSSKRSRHEITHNKTNMIKCHQCKMLFGKKDNMLQHKNIKQWMTFANLCLHPEQKFS